MPLGYQYRICSNFPEWSEKSKPLRVTRQLPLLGSGYDTANSELLFIGESEYYKYWKYHIKHEAERKMTVRFETRTVDRIIQVTEFDLYLSKDKGHLLVATNESDTNELLKRITDYKRDFKFSERQIDLAAMQREEAMDVGGGWFANLQIADVRSAAVFGDTVTESQEWERYTQSGMISMLYMNYLYGENSYKINVTKNGGVIILNSLSEEVRLQLVEIVSDRLTPYLVST